MAMKEEVARLEARLREAKRAVEIAHQDADAEMVSVLEWCEQEKSKVTREATDHVGALAKTYANMVKNLERVCEAKVKAAEAAFEEDRRKVQEEKRRVLDEAEGALRTQCAGVELEAQRRMAVEKGKAQALLDPLVVEVKRLETRLVEKTNKPPVGADLAAVAAAASLDTPVDGITLDKTPPDGVAVVKGPAGNA